MKGKKYILLLLAFYLCNICAVRGQTEESVEPTASPSWEKVKEEIEGYFQDFGLYLDKTRLLTIGELQSLPIGLQKKVGNSTCDLLITNAIFHTEYTEITAFLRITFPKLDGGTATLYFGGERIRISPTGGYIGDIKLALLADVEIFGKGKGFKLVFNSAKKSGNTPPTYAIIDCDGFKEMGINASLFVSQKHIRRIYNGEAVKSDVRIDFSCTSKGPDQIMAEINIPEFELTALPDWHFEAKKAIFDFSTEENYFSMDYYKIPGEKFYNGFPNLWTGLYIEDLSVKFPHFIQDKTTGKSPSFKVERIWLDERGFSGILEVDNILSIEKGSIGKEWMFSVDVLGISIVANKLTQGKMEGEVRLPLDVKNGFRYTGDFGSNGKMNLKVTMNESMSFDLWKSKSVEIGKNSYIKIAKKDSTKDVELLANLNGRMVLEPSLKKDDNSDKTEQKKSRFNLGNISFSGLKISNKEPYLHVEKLTLEKEIKIGNFPVSLRDIELKGIGASKSSLDFGVDVHLGNSKDGNFAGELDFSIKSVFDKTENNEKGLGKWNFDGFDVKEMQVDMSNSIFKLKGSAKFYEDDKRYGNGFQGSINFQLTMGIKFGLGANVMFGSMPSYRYWYVDVMALFSGAGIPIFPGFQISGIGGGAYQRMRMDSDNESNTMGERLTQTGIRYIPDSTISIGFKAFCQISTMGSELFTADLSLSVGLNQHKGLDHITLQGVAKMLPTPNMSGFLNNDAQIIRAIRSDTSAIEKNRKLAAKQAVISAIAQFTYDNKNKSFYGLFDSYLDFGLIKGIGPEGRIGICEMYFSDPKWFIHIGTPQQRLGLKIDIGLLDIRTSSYFLTGCDIPPMPPIPAKLRRLLNADQVSQLPQGRAISEINGGKGLAFGSDLSLNTGEMNFLFAYAKFESSIGFDILLKKYNGVFCNGKSENPGLNGWYACGQAYAYLYGDVGIRLKMFGAKRNFSILQGEIGSLLEAQLPNPAYFGGALGLNFSVLGGLFHGRCNFKFSIGEKCEMLESGFADGVEIIADAKPMDKAEAVDVFTIPQVAFNLPMEEEISAVFDGESSDLKILVDKYYISFGDEKVPGQIVWDNEKKLAQWIPRDILPSNSDCSLDVSISAKEKKGSTWKPLSTIEGGNYTESKKLSFITGQAPDSIPWSNVSVMYPVCNQEFFLPDEYKTGFVRLKMGQPDLINDRLYKKKVRFISSTGDTITESFTYNKAEKEIHFKIPSLSPSQKYSIEWVLVYNKENEQGGLGSTNTDIVEATEGNLLQIKEHSIIGDAIQENKDKVILCCSISSSKYKTLSEKLNAISFKQVYRIPYMWISPYNGRISPSPEVHYLQAEVKADEGFDNIDLYGNEYSNGPLIEVSGDTTNEPYFSKSIYPLVYSHYPYNGHVHFPRNSGEGLIPTWAIYISSYYSKETNNIFPWMYYLPYHYKLDFDKVLADLADARLPILNKYRAWLNKSFVPIPKGNYPIRLYYSIPNGNKGAECKKIFINTIN